MGQLGDMFPGPKLPDEDPGGEGSGQTFIPGPFDLDKGVIYLRRPTPPTPETPTDPED
jgi:hypothetical protein